MMADVVALLSIFIHTAVHDDLLSIQLFIRQFMMIDVVGLLSVYSYPHGIS